MVCGSVYLLWFGIGQISLDGLVVVDALVEVLATFEP